MLTNRLINKETRSHSVY